MTYTATVAMNMWLNPVLKCGKEWVSRLNIQIDFDIQQWFLNKRHKHWLPVKTKLDVP